MTTIHHLRLGFLGLAAMLAVALAWGNLRNEPSRANRNTPTAAAPIARTPVGGSLAQVRASVEARFAQADDFAGFAKKYSASYPGDWSELMDKLAHQRASGSLADNPDAAFAEALRELRRTRGIVAATASAPALSRIFDTQAATLAALSVLDKRQCVDFLLGQQNSAFPEFSSRHRPLIAKMADAALDAILDGSASNIIRTAPGDPDFALLENALRANGLGSAEIEALLDGRHPDPPLPDARLCEAGMIYLDALKTLPDDVRLRLYAFSVEMMARM